MSQHPWPRATVAWYAVFMLSLANALSFVARTILSLLVDPVKADLHVSDTAISLLHGFSFAVVFAFIGLPVSRLADKGNRRDIIALSVFAWSAMTAFCGLATSYAMLLIGRLGAGAGEGGFGPASQAILADYFPRERLALATGVYSMGIYVGSGLALIGGGAVVQWAAVAGVIHMPLIGAVKAWQFAFLMVGLPGILFALLLFGTVPEPARQQAEGGARRAGFAEITAHLRAHPLVYGGFLAGFSLHVLVGFGAATWSPALLGRHFGIPVGQIGLIYGSIFLACGIVGSVVGGLLGNHLIRRGIANGNAWIGFVAYGINVLFGIGYAFADTPWRLWICIAGMNLFSAAGIGAGFTVVNEITPNRMRAQIGALFLFCINLFGTGLGPTAVALIGDTMFTGTFALAQSVALTSLLFGIPAIGLLWLTVKYYPPPISD